ncbi:hypothetical protein, partial [Aureimonas sp. AU4]|uniref:hypothetical protein n=1 Tax=Aureimonas sp. AU4 TaxID=1638163 RepID=UPI0012E3756B
MTLNSDAFRAQTLQDRRAPARRRRSRANRLAWICGTAALAVVLGAGVSPTAVEPTGEALAMLAEGWHAAAALPAVAR